MKKLIFFIVFIALAIILIAQEIQHETIVVNIEVPVRVFDGGKFVEDLTINDFNVYEDGKLQDVVAVYLIKQTKIERKEEKRQFEPKTSRNFYLFFEITNTSPRIQEAIDYFVQNVLLPGDNLWVISPTKTYKMKSESLEVLPKEEVVKQLEGIMRRDAWAGSSDYRSVVDELTRIARTLSSMFGGRVVVDDHFDAGLEEIPEDIKLEILLNLYSTTLEKLEHLRSIDQQKLLEFASLLKEEMGQKYVFLFYERELIPTIEPRLVAQASGAFQDNPNILATITDLFYSDRRDASIDVERIKKAYADASTAIHFLFFTKPAEHVSGIYFEEHSEDIFSPFMEMAKATGGSAESSASPRFLFKNAVEASENYYLLYYRPSNYKEDGKFKNIEVKVRGKNYRVTHRAGYFAEKIDSRKPVKIESKPIERKSKPVERDSKPVKKETIKKPLPFLERGLSKYKSGDFSAAVEDFTRAVDVDPTNALAYYYRGIAFEDLDDPYSAIEDYTKAIEINPSYAEAYNNRGCLMVKEGDYEEAIKDFTKAIKIKPDYATAYFNRGNAWIGLAEYSNAIKDFKRAIELDPKKKEKASEKIKFCESKIRDK